jgi:hypothetical protein
LPSSNSSSSFIIDFRKILKQIPLETNIRELTELVMAKGKYVPSWAGVVKKYLVETSKGIEKYKCVLSDTLETIGSFSSSINYYAEGFQLFIHIIAFLQCVRLKM